MTQISLSNVAVEFGATSLLQGVTFTVAAGERWGIVGRNGSGKTTLFNIITGAQLPTRGAVARQQGLRLALLEQHRDFGEAATVWEAAATPFAHLIELERSLAAHTDRLGELGERATESHLDHYARDLERFEREGGYTYHARVDAVLHGLGFDPEEARTRTLERLSGGERGRLGLACQLVAPADVLLLDEPTNHLDLETTAWLEQYLRDAGETVLVVSHDRAFLDRVVDHVLHLEAGSAEAYTGGYSAFVQQREERRLTQQRQFDQQRRTIAKEEDYIRRNIAGQNSRQAKGRRKRLERVPRLSAPPGEEGSMSLRLETSERGGDQAVIAEHVTVKVNERVLVKDFSATVRRGDVVGLVGPNGAGKSTFLRSLMGEHPIASGELRSGGSVTPAYYRQDLSQLPVDRSLFDIINDLRPSWGRGPVLGHLARFGFTGDSVQRTSTTLSGGERSRMALAMIMLSRANLLLLDEPTNHLDVESIEALEDALDGYDGTVILVSHDRALLRALTTRVWSLRDLRITDYDGSFAEWEEVSAEAEREAAAAASAEESARRERERRKSQAMAAKGGGGSKGGDGDTRRGDDRAARRAAREMEAAEADVARLESRVSELAAALEDPSLYDGTNGVKRAQELGAEMELTKRKLEDALARWEELGVRAGSGL